jgi:hypothetical protein
MKFIVYFTSAVFCRSGDVGVSLETENLSPSLLFGGLAFQVPFSTTPTCIDLTRTAMSASAAPPDIPRERYLFFCRRPALLCFKSLDDLDSCNVVIELGSLAAFTELHFRCNLEVDCGDFCRLRRYSSLSISSITSFSGGRSMYLFSITSSAS